MKPSQLPFLCHMALICLVAAINGRASSVSDVVGQMDEDSYRAFHRGLYVTNGMNRGFSVGGTIRFPSNQHDLARDFIYRSFSESGLETASNFFSFSASGATYSNACNVIAVKPGTDTNAGYYVIGCHYDSADPSGSYAQWSPGADDNASGVAGVLEIARTFAGRSFRSSLVFAAFDAEEQGLQGAYKYIATRTTSVSNSCNNQFTNIYRGNIRGMISLDMIAFNPAPTNKAYIYGGSASLTPVKANLISAAATYGGIAATNGGQKNQSDHAPFSTTTPPIDSCLLIEYNCGSNPSYHRTSDSTDTPGYIDYAFALKMSRSAAGYLAVQAELVPTIQVAATGTSVPELGAGTGSFTVTRDGTNGPLVVSYAVSGTATATDDYDALPGSVTIEDGQSNATIDVSAHCDSLPEGPETVRIVIGRSPSYGIAGTDEASLTIDDVPVDSWRHSWFTPDELTNTAVSSDLADPDSNAIPNLMEYALGRNPRATNLSPPMSTMAATNDGYYSIIYQRRTNLQDAFCAIIVSTNLFETNWLSGAGVVEEHILSTNQDPETVRARVLNPDMESTDRIFLRLRVTRP